MIGASKKLLQATAGNAGGAGLDITDVFSTYLYTGNGSTQTITNGIDLDGEGGLVWVKMRGLTRDHALVDTERGVRRNLKSNTTAAEGVAWGDNVNAFYSNGFLAGPDGSVNTSSEDYVSWTFRKAPKFFDVVTYTGDGTSDRVINHNLGVAPGVVIIKATSVVGDWWFTHRLVGTDGGNNLSMRLNTTDAATGYGIRASTDSPTTFTLRGTNNAYYANNNGVQYVAYLFAHNDGDGEFGPDGNADIIKCGSYTGNGSTNGPEIDLGFEPQWILFKNASAATSGGVTCNWRIYDTMRGWVTGGDEARLFPNLSNAENAANDMDLTATGFKVTNSSGSVNGSGENHIYIAIRRGPLAQPESGTDVFATHLDTSGAQTFYTTGFPVDAMLQSYTTLSTTNNHTFPTRLMGFNSTDKSLQTSSSAAEASLEVAEGWDSNTGFKIANEYVTSNETVHHAFRRAPGFFDVVAYTGDGTQGRSLAHNLQASPELIIFKSRSTTGDWPTWCLYTSIYNAKRILTLNTSRGTDSFGGNTDVNSVSSTDVNIDHAAFAINTSGTDYICYLFSSLNGVSKVGSFTHINGSDTTVDCGFSSGARFVLVKMSSSADNWFVYDTARGINAGTEPYLTLNTDSNEATGTDAIDPTPSGFVWTSGNNTGDYIFYAIA